MKRSKYCLAALSAALLFCVLSACGAESPAEPDSEPEETVSPAPQEPELSPEELAQQAEEARQQRIRDYVDTMSLEEKVGQLFFVRCPEENALEDLSAYHLGGYLLFSRDYKDGDTWLTRQQFTEKIQSYQDAADLPLFIGSDEEGGTVTRASRNPNLFDIQFLSPQMLYALHEDSSDPFKQIVSDAAEKSRSLLELGINVNFAPVCDVSTDPEDFIYDRALGLDAEATAEYAALMVNAMNKAGMISVLKHFPGYGNNVDTHTGIAVDTRPYEEFLSSDLLPFQAGAEAGAPFVLVSHNIVECMDPTLPASLSPEVHRVLREECGFDGVAITDDLAMDAVAAYAGDGAVAVLALQAGNDMICTTDYQTQIPAVIEAVENGTLPERVIDAACFRVLNCKDQFLTVPQFVN